MKALLLEPYIASAVWGGRRLIESWGMRTDKENAAEAWLLSCHPSGECRVVGGRFNGVTLSEILLSHPEYLGDFSPEKSNEFPVLIKLIDAHDDLSVQVHPTVKYCNAVQKTQTFVDSPQPKTECWLILDCEPGARLALGFRSKTTPEQVRQALADGTFMELVNFIPVKPGDFFFIPSGTLHAIGGGILLAEVQQSSDTTYRLYDYNRPGLDGKPRPLHVDEALGCLDFSAADSSRFITQDGDILCDCDNFKVTRLHVEKSQTLSNQKKFYALLALNGNSTLEQAGELLTLKKGACVFVPANSGEYILRGKSDLLVICSDYK